MTRISSGLNLTLGFFHKLFVELLMDWIWPRSAPIFHSFLFIFFPFCWHMLNPILLKQLSVLLPQFVITAQSSHFIFVCHYFLLLIDLYLTRYWNTNIEIFLCSKFWKNFIFSNYIPICMSQYWYFYADHFSDIELAGFYVLVFVFFFCFFFPDKSGYTTDSNCQFC